MVYYALTEYEMREKKSLYYVSSFNDRIFILIYCWRLGRIWCRIRGFSWVTFIIFLAHRETFSVNYASGWEFSVIKRNCLLPLQLLSKRKIIFRCFCFKDSFKIEIYLNTKKYVNPTLFCEYLVLQNSHNHYSNFVLLS